MPVEPKPPAPRSVSGKRFDALEADGRDGGDDELRDAVAARDAERLAAVIDQDDFDLAAIVGVDRARRVQDGDAVLQREAGARAHLAFEASRDRERDAGGDGVNGAGRDRHLFGCDEVGAAAPAVARAGGFRPRPCGRVRIWTVTSLTRLLP